MATIKSILCGWLGCPNPTTAELPSPKIRIRPDQVHIVNGTLEVTGLDNCFIAAIDVTNSMEPFIDDGMFVILDPIVPHTDIIPGDIIWYSAPSFSAIHRVVRVGNDGTWFCNCRGDNNEFEDGINIRAEDIRGVFRGLIV